MAHLKRSTNMKSFALGFISALVIAGIAGLLSFQKLRGPESRYGIMTKEEPSGRQGGFEVYQDGRHLFGYYVFSNGFSLNVPGDQYFPPRMYYGQSDQGARGV